MGKWGTGKKSCICNVCKSIFLSRIDRIGDFCSQECQRKGRKRQKKINKIFICLECNKKVLRPNYDNHNFKFCSVKCSSVFKAKTIRGKSHHRWKNGISKRSYNSIMVIKKLKKKIKACERCFSEENLQGHHKIKYSDRPDLGDDINNIEILCSQCHAKEHPELAGMISIPPKRFGKNLNCVMCKREYYVPKHKINSSKCCNRKCNSKRALEIKNGKRQMDE